MPRKIDVIEAEYREIFGDPNPTQARFLQRTEGLNVAGDQDSRDRIAALTSPEELPHCLSTGLFGKPIKPRAAGDEDSPPIVRDPLNAKGIPVAGESFLGRASRRAAVDQGNPLVSESQQMLHCQKRPPPVLDMNRVE